MSTAVRDGLQQRLLLEIHRLARRDALGRRQGRAAFVGGHEGELLDPGRILVGLRLDLAEHVADRPGRLAGSGRIDALAEKVALDLLAEPLRALAEMAVQRRLECVGGAPGALQRLRGDAQPVDIAEPRRLRLAGIVAVEVRGRVGREQVELDEGRHGGASDGGSGGGGRGRSGAKLGVGQRTGRGVVVVGEAGAGLAAALLVEPVED